ncbi:MAG: TetR family transcriptional regulator C-terminal domain-containing protein [Oscillospiraceae bacterium]|nr:TetR family transcriptional regulator C-terminal domain-containing protein [Oscillospiraceae bacterium]
MNVSNNKRFQETEKRIQNCVLDLIDQDPDTQLTVSAICEVLSINRSSFYIHHKSVQSVLDSILARFHKEQMDLCSSGCELSAASPLSVTMQTTVKYLVRHQSFYCYYAKYSNSAFLYGQYIQELLKLLSPSVPLLHDLSELQIAYLGEFIQGGVISMLKRWLENNREDSCQEIVDLFTSVISSLDGRL